MRLYHIKHLVTVVLALLMLVSVVSAQKTEALKELLIDAEQVIGSNPLLLDSIISFGFKEASLTNDVEALSKLHTLRGISSAMKNDYGPALQAFQESWVLAIQIKDTRLQVNALTNMAGVHQFAGQLDKGAEKLERAIKLLENTDYEETKATTHLGLGIIYESSGKLSQAKQNLRKAMDIFDREQNVSKYLFCVEELGGILEHENDFRSAITLYEFALDGREQADETAYTISIYQRLGSAYVNLKEYAKAQKNLEYSLLLSDSLKNHLGVDSTLILLVKTSANLGELDMISHYTQRLVQFHKQQEAKNVEETLASLETEYLLSEQALENKLLKAESEQAKAELAKSNTLMYSSMIISALLLLIAVLTFVYLRRERDLSRQLAQFNEQLEEKVMEKTAEVVSRNQRLRQMSFQLAHELRSGVATILGLKNLMDENEFPDTLDREIYDGFTDSTRKLDVAITKMISQLDEDEAAARKKQEAARVKAEA